MAFFGASHAPAALHRQRDHHSDGEGTYAVQSKLRVHTEIELASRSKTCQTAWDKPHEVLCSECNVPCELIGELHLELQLDVDFRNRHVWYLPARSSCCEDDQPEHLASKTHESTSWRVQTKQQ